jgi:hypothetical protein
MKKAAKRYRTPAEDRAFLESAKCREIVQEILNFGVSQHQIQTLIKLLALELEDNNLMKKIVEIVNDYNEDVVDKPTITV